MLYALKLLFFLINIDQKTVLNWFGLAEPETQKSNQLILGNWNSSTSIFKGPTTVSLETFRLVLEGLWQKIQVGLTLPDIESFLVFILFLRFFILLLRYNLQTSFSITFIGLFAGYFWYRHLIDLVSMYRDVLLKLPLVHSLGTEGVQTHSTNPRIDLTESIDLTEFKPVKNVHWYNPGQIIYYAFAKGIRHLDQDTGISYYIDPISMFLSSLPEPYQAKILPIYYEIVSQTLPKISEILSKFWNQFSSIAAYVTITRLGKRYCPYLIRWHWTFLLVFSVVEPILVSFIDRVYYFQMFVLTPKIASIDADSLKNILFQINSLNLVLAFFVLTHIGFIFFGLFHALFGQYFYFPFLVENTELHVGLRPKNSIYSGGKTAWQNPEEKDGIRLFRKLWFGWFGRGSKGNFTFVTSIVKLIQKSFKKFKKYF